MKQDQRWGLLAGLLAVCCWSGFIIVTRLAGLSKLTPYDVMALRFTVGSFLLLPFARRWCLINLRGLSLVGVGGIGYTAAVYHGFQQTSALHGAVLLTGCIPFTAALFSAWLLQDRPGPMRLFGLSLIAISGYLMLTESDQTTSLTGDLWLLLAALAWGLYTVLIKHWHIPPMSGAVTVAFGSTLFYLPVYLLLLPKHMDVASTTEILLQAFYQGLIATVVAMLLYLWAVASIGPAAMGALMALVPVVSTVAALTVLDEQLSLQGGVALAFAFFGAVFSAGLLQRDRMSTPQ